MTTDRIKEIQSKTAYPDSISVQQALLQVWNECEQEQLRIANVSDSLPSLDDATKVAVRISEEAIKPPLDAKEQAMFIAGFQECIKWLNVVFSNDR